MSYRDNLDAALARVEALEVENRELRAKLAGKIPLTVKGPDGEDILWIPPQEIGPHRSVTIHSGPSGAANWDPFGPKSSNPAEGLGKIIAEANLPPLSAKDI
tara:strand:- start:160 stop:465 length:306 start_codon:yes stop_codon:yes gene_type:complete